MQSCMVCYTDKLTMSEMFTSDFFVGNRARLRDLFTGKAPIVITAAGQLQRGNDSTYPFHQDANFWYLTGIDEPDMVLVMDKGKEYLILPERSDYQDIFDGSVDTSELTRISGIKAILSASDGWKQLGARIKKVKHVATLAAPKPYIEIYGMYANPARAELVGKLKSHNVSLKLLDLRIHLTRLRMLKQTPELKAMQIAINLTAGAIKRVQKRLPKLLHEYEIEAEITAYFLKHGADNAWKPIVAAGDNACVMHYHSNQSAIAPDNLVMIDIGAEVHHYAADITRTFSSGAKPSRRQQIVHKAVQEVQDFAFGLLKPGVMIKAYEQQIEHFMGEKLRELGLIKTIEREQVRKYFPHATSHFLGLEPHDAGNYDQALEAGVVITVEPGIYIPEEGIGVRIEDDVLITENGIEILSRRLPRDLL